MAFYIKGSFITVPNKYSLSKVDAIAQAIFLWLCGFANDNGECFPSVGRLATLCQVSETTVRDRLKTLEEEGFISIKRRKKDELKNETNLYHINLVDERGTSAPEVGGTSAGEGGVPQELMGELNPVLTKSNNTHNGETDVSRTNEDEEEEGGYSEYFGFVLPQGYYQDTQVNNDTGQTIYTLYDKFDRAVKQTEINRLKKEYETRKRTQQPAKAPPKEMLDAVKFISIYQTLCQQILNITPKYGHKEKMAIYQAIKRYGVDNLRKVAQWYLYSNAEDKDKLNILNVTYNKIINQFQLETGINL